MVEPPPFFYTWSNGDNDDFTDNLCPDTVYSIIVFDPGCYLDTVTFVIPTAGINLSVQDLFNSNCYSPCSGSVTLDVEGGSGFFEYQWSTGDTDDALNSLCAGNYSVTVSDPGCSIDTLSFAITSPDQLIASVDSVETLICSYDCNAGAQLIISGGTPPLSYLWSDGETTLNAYSLCAGNNSVTVFDPGCDGDTVDFAVLFISDIQLLSDFYQNPTCNDTCNGTAFVSAWDGIDPYTFLWDDGQTTDSAFNLCDGIHTVIVTDSLGCAFTDTLNLTEPPAIENNPLITRSHCEKPDGILFTSADGGTAPYYYEWSTGSTEQTITELVQGNYEITVTDSFGCHLYDTITLKGLYPDLQVSSDTTILIGEYANVTVNGATFYSWSPDYNMDCDTCDFTLVNPTYTSTYCVIGTDTFGCMDTTCVRIIVSHDCGVIYLPTAFTPNGDGHNDVFRVLGKCIFSVHMVIYNRWGQKIFESEDRHSGWNGKYQSENSEVGVYTYEVEAVNLLGEKFYQTGNVTLLR